MEELFEHMRRRLSDLPEGLVRQTQPAIDWNCHMLGLVGPRGVGKTTLFLQHIKCDLANDNALYVTADHLYFSTHTLFEVAERFCVEGGHHLLIDEVHTYECWSKELKAICDSFPDLQVCFTGSSVLDIAKGVSDLSRRAPIFRMHGLSFREFLLLRHGIAAPLLSLDEVLTDEVEIEGVTHPLPLFHEYLKSGYYPFGSDPAFDLELSQVVDRTLGIDIPLYCNMTAATSRKLKRLLAIVSTLTPFKPNMVSLASQIQVSRNNVADYLCHLERAGLIAQLRSGAGGLGALAKTEKVYLDNTNLLYCLAAENVDIGTVRETFFFNQLRFAHDITSSAVADFECEGATFEIGGRSKGANQLKDAECGYVVKDGIEHGHGNVRALWEFGLLY